MQRQTTKELLAKSFMEFARTKPVNKVTVANITENCGMTPPTFYRHFRDKCDLTAWIYAANAQKMCGQNRTRRLCVAGYDCYGTGRYLMKWLTDGMPTPPEKVAEIMEACLPEPLKLYL